MTWSEFGWNAGANTIGSLIGVIVGVPVALWLERRRQGRDEAAASAHREAETRAAMDDRRQKLETVVALLDQSLAINIAAIDATEKDVAIGLDVFAHIFDIETWDLLKHRFVELTDEPRLVALLAAAFTTIELFKTKTDHLLRLDPAYPGRADLGEALVQLGPTLRHQCSIARSQLNALR